MALKCRVGARGGVGRGLCTQGLSHRRVGSMSLYSEGEEHGTTGHGSMREGHPADFCFTNNPRQSAGDSVGPRAPDNWYSLDLQSHSQMSYSASP